MYKVTIKLLCYAFVIAAAVKEILIINYWQLLAYTSISVIAVESNKGKDGITDLLYCSYKFLAYALRSITVALFCTKALSSFIFCQRLYTPSKLGPTLGALHKWQVIQLALNSFSPLAILALAGTFIDAAFFSPQANKKQTSNML
jgi:hypothetical protein